MTAAFPLSLQEIISPCSCFFRLGFRNQIGGEILFLLLIEDHESGCPLTLHRGILGLSSGGQLPSMGTYWAGTLYDEMRKEGRFP